MAPRRSVRSVKSVNNVNYSNITLGDVLCPICRCILIQPVTLPCSHDYCLPCFEGTLANANLTCPLCRIRFGSWHRIAKKDNKIVNEKLWDVLQQKFADHVQNRLRGVEENLEEDAPIHLTTPGEIRKEYEAQKRQQQLEMQKTKEIQEKASVDLIMKLKEQEEHEENSRKEKLRLDEQVARQIAKDMGFVAETSSKSEDIKKRLRPLDKFIKKGSDSDKNSVAPTVLKNIFSTKVTSIKQKMNFTVEVSDSNDSIENECKYFKPIDHRNIPPSQFVTIVKVPARFEKTNPGPIKAPSGNSLLAFGCNGSAFARFETVSPILPPTITSPNMRLRKRKRIAEPEKPSKALKIPKVAQHAPKRRPSIKDLCCKVEPPKRTKMTLRDRKISGSPFRGFDASEMNLNGLKSTETKEVQMKKDLEYAKKLQEQFNKERYSTRSSITCGNNIRKQRQLTITEIMSTSKCK
ncbi:PREDICTED: E3 ubiquitin-protein ligase RNF169-like isoform X1 [Nicrophorus vespilloides]|uniref:RING-type E3 ubiquitin transferase n=1 Tax=Nicrophorus vespilloides TaxID=110193 RepID=A0ABM1NHU7_NICVS|nr:PREDICTED: E3 ubiquitin-protein ligase RNF169-like isoform X1 [Nicrophorus vespilloides]